MRHDTQIHQRFVYLIWPPSILACCHGDSYITVRVWSDGMTAGIRSGCCIVYNMTWLFGFTFSISCLFFNLLQFRRIDALAILVSWWSQCMIFSFRLWFHPVWGYQTCLIFSADSKTHLFSFFMYLLATRCIFLHEIVVFETTWKGGSVWSSVILLNAQFFSVTIYKVSKYLVF